MEYGCIGEHLGHSFSRELHGRIGSYSYVLREVSPEELPEFLTRRDFKGINVTVPYKVAVLPYLDETDENAQRIGAVNTVVNRGGRLLGYNTDFDGMRALLRSLGLELQGKNVLILGTGGTSRTARAVAESLGARRITFVSRRPGPGHTTYEAAGRDFPDTQILLNTTPCGMYPGTEDCPIAPELFPRLEGAADAVYNPLRSRLVQRVQAMGLPAAGGLRMLTAQAVYAAGKFFSSPCDADSIDAIYRGLLREKENIVLTGMPGAGKTTVGRALAQALGCPFLDTDQELTRVLGAPPGEIIRSRGLPAFREAEAGVIRELRDRRGTVIATGGGAVLDPENIRNLKANGRILFLDRPPEAIGPTPDRPLSCSREKLRALYKERLDTYVSTCDARIPNALRPEEAVRAILDHLKG